MANQVRISAILITVAYRGNKPEQTLYELGKLPAMVVDSIGVSISTGEKDWDVVSCGDLPKHNEPAHIARMDTIEAAKVNMDVSCGIPDEYKIEMCVAYLVQ